MGFTFLVIVAVMTVVTVARPLQRPYVFEGGAGVDPTPDPLARIMGFGVLLATAALHVVFR